MANDISDYGSDYEERDPKADNFVDSDYEDTDDSDVEPEKRYMKGRITPTLWANLHLTKAVRKLRPYCHYDASVEPTLKQLHQDIEDRQRRFESHRVLRNRQDCDFKNEYSSARRVNTHLTKVLKEMKRTIRMRVIRQECVVNSQRRSKTNPFPKFNDLRPYFQKLCLVAETSLDLYSCEQGLDKDLSYNMYSEPFRLVARETRKRRHGDDGAGDHCVPGSSKRPRFNDPVPSTSAYVVPRMVPNQRDLSQVVPNLPDISRTARNQSERLQSRRSQTVKADIYVTLLSDVDGSLADDEETSMTAPRRVHKKLRRRRGDHGDRYDESEDSDD